MKLAQKFVPILVDGDADKEFTKANGLDGTPVTLFVDAKGKEVSRVEGFVETPAFLNAVKSALKKIGPVAPKKAVKELEDAAAALAKAQEKKDWKATLKAVAAIEKIHHDGPALEAARKAKADAAEEAKKRLDLAKELQKTASAPDARAAFLRIATEFEGTDAAVEAKELIKKIDAAAPPPK